MNIPSLSSEIFLSRDAIRLQLIEEIKYYLDLVDVDLTKSSFLSYIINILSTLTANILFYQISVYKEFFLTKAQLSNSVMDLSASIGYSPNLAKHANLNLILTFPFTFTDPEVIFIFPKYTTFQINNIYYILDYNLKFIIENNSVVTVYRYDDNISETVPVYIKYDENTFNVLITVKQYNIEQFEFSVNQHNLEYQFTEYELKLNGQLADIQVKVVEPGNDIEYIYKRFPSIYLMSSSDKGFVVRKSDIGQKVYFGNGLIGYQPPVGSIIYITAFTTLGSKGNIVRGQSFEHPIIFDTNGYQINYTITNPSPASGGIDEPTLEEIKSNAINNLSSLHRLVSEKDYRNITAIANEKITISNTYPILKRSDIRVNEMQIFSILNYNNKIVPTNNIYITIDSTSSDDIEYIDKYSIFEFNNYKYIIPFNLEIHKDLEITKYKYVSKNVDYKLNLVSTHLSLDEYKFFADHVTISTDEKIAKIQIFFQTDEPDFHIVECKIEITNTLINRNMTINTSINAFEIEFNPYTVLPEEKETYYFTFSHPTKGRLNQYSVSFIFRKNLDHTMLSNTIVHDDNTITIYDIPVIEYEYYQSIINKSDFEYFVIQKTIENINLEDVRMMTDFANIKFANSSKKLKNMLLNKETKLPVDFIYLDKFLHIPREGERFIINGTELPEWANFKNRIAICTKSININDIVYQDPNNPTIFYYNNEDEGKIKYIDPNTNDTYVIEWLYIDPEMDDFVYVRYTDKKYLYTSCEWIEPIYDIPLKIELDVKLKPDYDTNIQNLINYIKEFLVESFKDRMVCQSHLSRSEIISTVQNIDGVDHCRLILPQSNIFYNFKLENLKEEDLLVYTPELLYFDESDITIRLV